MIKIQLRPRSGIVHHSEFYDALLQDQIGCERFRLKNYPELLARSVHFCRRSFDKTHLIRK